jgi:hypothetical protein
VVLEPGQVDVESYNAGVETAAGHLDGMADRLPSQAATVAAVLREAATGMRALKLEVIDLAERPIVIVPQFDEPRHVHFDLRAADA